METILDALDNAYYNLSSPIGIVQQQGLKKLWQAKTLLRKGYPMTTHIYTMITNYPDLETAPEYTGGEIYA